MLAFRRRHQGKPKRPLSPAAQYERQLAYDEAISNVFFHRSLRRHLDTYGLPPAELLLERRRISLREWERIYAESTPIEPPSHWIGLRLQEADGVPAQGYPYRLKDSGGAIHTGKLDTQGQAQVHGLKAGAVDVSFGMPLQADALAPERKALADELQHILQAERQERAARESEFEQQSLLGKAITVNAAFSKGARQALWGILSSLKEWSDLGTQHLNHALGAAWEAWRYSDEGRFAERFTEQLAEREFREFVEALGFDPSSLSREQWAEVQALLNFIWNDPTTRETLTGFAKQYLEAQHPLEWAEAGGGLIAEVAFDLVLTALTLGAGATIAVLSKVRHLTKFKGLGRVLIPLANKLKLKAGSRQVVSSTGKWLKERLKKPENRRIRKGQVDETGGADTTENSGTMLVENDGADSNRSAGAMARREYQAAPYHGKVDNTVKSRAPTNGQNALDTSVRVKSTSPRRIGIDYQAGEFTVFDQTSNGLFHGHVRSWKDLTPQMQNALRKAGMVDKKGIIILGGGL
ncbi:MAG: hypothetical protein P8103_08365 [Candidatus Thiodiazotropha sp.]